MVNPIVQFDSLDFTVWGRQKDVRLNLPKNPWLLRRRSEGVKYEVERLFASFSKLQLSPEDAKDGILTFLSSEYQRNAVYYHFINMRIGIRRMAVCLLDRYLRRKSYGTRNTTPAV